jgi:hypothetical protein
MWGVKKITRDDYNKIKTLPKNINKGVSASKKRKKEKEKRKSQKKKKKKKTEKRKNRAWPFLCPKGKNEKKTLGNQVKKRQ